MKGLICYFSTTGNTKLACEFITGHIQNVSFSLLDISRESLPDLDSYQVVGFAAFADFLAPSVRMTNFIKTLPLQKQKPAFVFNTYGNINGKTLIILKKAVEERGFKIVNHCPNKAVYTKKMKNTGHYPRPNEQLRAKLGK